MIELDKYISNDGAKKIKNFVTNFTVTFIREYQWFGASTHIHLRHFVLHAFLCLSFSQISIYCLKYCI